MVTQLMSSLQHAGGKTWSYGVPEEDPIHM